MSVERPKPMVFRFWQLLGMILGAAVVLFSLFERRESPFLTAPVVVNDIPITYETLEFANKMILKNDPGRQRGGFSPDSVLDILIDQELLLQQALRIRLLYHDRRLRNMAVKAALDDIISADVAVALTNFPEDSEQLQEEDQLREGRLKRFFGDLATREDVRLADQGLRILNYEDED